MQFDCTLSKKKYCYYQKADYQDFNQQLSIRLLDESLPSP